MAKKNKKKCRKFRIFIVALFFLLFFCFVLILIGAYVLEIKTKAIIIHDNDIVTDKEIITMANLKDYPNFFLTTSNSIKKSLMNNSFIKEVEVKKNFLFQIHIYVSEYEPLLIREDTNMIVLDVNKEIVNDEKCNLEIPSLINYVPNTKYEKLLSKMKDIDYELLQKISQIMYSPTKYDEDRFILFMNDSNRVYINLPKFKSFNKYDEMVTKFEGKTGKLYLDSGNYFEIDK